MSQDSIPAEGYQQTNNHFIFGENLDEEPSVISVSDDEADEIENDAAAQLLESKMKQNEAFAKIKAITDKSTCYDIFQNTMIHNY